MRHLLAATIATLAALALPAAATASIEITPSTLTVVDGTTVTFNATADANSTPTWSFDDGTVQATGTTVSHTFTGVGEHIVTVIESGASSGTATITVTVTAAPPPSTQWTSSPYPGTPVSGPPPGFKFPLFAASAKPRRMAVGHAAILASCLFPKGVCHGTVVLRSAKPVRDRKGRKARVVELGRKAFTVAADASATVAIAVPSRLRTLVAKLGRLGAVAVVNVHDDAGNTADDTVKLTLTR